MTRPTFDQYVAARGAALLRFAYLLCGDRHLAEDLVQEVLIKAHRRWTNIETDNPDAYLKRALVRTHVSWLRRRAASEITTATIREDTSTTGFADAQATRDEMWALLATLPRAQRAVLVLRYFEDLDDHHIADLVGISPNTVRVHAHRGLHTLRETLAHKAEQAPTRPDLLDTVRRGAARAAVRRKAAIAGSIAAVAATLALLLPILLPDKTPPPVQPSPSVSPTSDLVLLPTPLTAPEFPYEFGFIPPGLGPAYVRMLYGSIEIDFGGGFGFGGLTVAVGHTLGFDVGENASTTSIPVEIDGVPATLQRDEATGFVNWVRDGTQFGAVADFTALTGDDLVRMLSSMRPGITAGTVAQPIDDIVSVAMPPGYRVDTRTERKVCLVPGATPDRQYICIEVMAGSALEPPIEEFPLDGGQAYITDIYGEFWVERPDGRTIRMNYDREELDLTTADLVRIYRGIVFRD